jgi:chemotaxis protein CheX
MDPSFISPFIQSVQNVFSTMLQLPVSVGEPHLKEGARSSHDVSGIIGMSGDVTGCVVLSFASATAERIVALFTGHETRSDSDDFADAVGELVNMISGGAKANFPNRRVSISVPSVVVGPGHTIARQSEVPCVIIPCATDCGEMVIEVAIQEQSSAAAVAA